MASPSLSPWVNWSTTPVSVVIAGHAVPGEMMLVGQGLADAAGTAVEPALVDPLLPVDWRSPDWAGRSLDYWPSYAELNPQARAAYLGWLSSGRRHPDVPVGYVFLFFYGLERRALRDLAGHSAADLGELRAIADEVDGLLDVYGTHRSFQRYAREFRQALELRILSGSDVTSGAAPAPHQEPVPAVLRLGLSGFAATGRPLPHDWALSWSRSRPDHFPRTPAVRCQAEYEALFAARYRARFGDGLILQARGSDITVEYYPASPGFRHTVRIRAYARPDVFDQVRPLQQLTELTTDCTEGLDPYSRFLGRRPEERSSLAAVVLLPPELQDVASGEAGALLEWARSFLGGIAMVTVPARQLAQLLGTDTPSKKELVDVVRLLDGAGIGIEPDLRMGGPLQTADRIVLFRAGDAPESTASPTYQSAALLLHLGAAVSAADGHVAIEEKALLLGHLESALDLSPGERTRLRAHLRWLLTTELKITGLARRVGALDTGQRERLAAFLAEVAAADGIIDPAEVELLRRIRKLLGLDPDAVHTSLHTAAVSPRLAEGPVTVREAGPALPGHVVPEPDGRVRLDASLLVARLAEAAEVAALLGSVFDEEEPFAPSAVPEAVEPVAGLDPAHSTLLRTLAGRTEVTRAEWEQLAFAARLLPDGALDRLNEAAIENTGEPVAEGDDPIEINQYAMGELL